MINVKMTKAKTVAAAVGTTLTAVQSVLVAFSGMLADDQFTIADGSALAGIVVSALGTVYAVWRVPNRPADVPSALHSR